jgi:hypothetical protein
MVRAALPLWVAALVLSSVPSSSAAQSDPAPETPPPSEVPVDAPPAQAPEADDVADAPDADDEIDTRTPRERELEARIAVLEQTVDDLADRVGGVEDTQQYDEEQHERETRETLHIGGYGDIGAFYVSGDGSGIRPDTGHLIYPDITDVPDSWVFRGDPLSTAINSRGEPADTGPSRAVVFDPVDSRGAFSFIVNTLTLTGFATLAQDFSANWRIDFLPRRRNSSDPGGLGFGDFVDIRLAYLEYRYSEPAFDVSIAVGKIDSVLGVEYRTQDAPDRMEVTPSLLCRYTCGRPIGARARFRFTEARTLILNIAVTNAGHGNELFPFSADVNLSHAVTGSGRLSFLLPIGPGIEIGVSGSVGPQDMQVSDSIIQSHFGVDLLADWDDLYFAAEFVIGEAPGQTAPGDVRCGLAPCLFYRAAYGRVGYRFLTWLMPYVRVDWRQATHQDGASFVYFSELTRFTVGFHFDVSSTVIVKAEYTANVELGPGTNFPTSTGQFDDDIFTASLVARF